MIPSPLVSLSPRPFPPPRSLPFYLLFIIIALLLSLSPSPLCSAVSPSKKKMFFLSSVLLSLCPSGKDDGLGFSSPSAPEPSSRRHVGPDTHLVPPVTDRRWWPTSVAGGGTKSSVRVQGRRRNIFEVAVIVKKCTCGVTGMGSRSVRTRNRPRMGSDGCQVVRTEPVSPGRLRTDCRVAARRGDLVISRCRRAGPVSLSRDD